MVDLVYGRGITDIVREIPLYVSIFKKFAGIKLFHTKPALYGSADIINVCNLKKQNLFVVTLVGGEPTMRPEIIDVFCEEMPRRICVVTNGYFPLKRIKNLYFYWISLDGTEKAHDIIRGKGSYAITKSNILEYIKGPPRNGKPAWKDIWISMTINTVNYSTAIDLAEEWV